MLTASHVSKDHGATAVLEDVSLSVTAESRLGVVGPNGIGKSTLLRILAGLEEPDRGKVTRTPASVTVGYLPQERDLRGGETLLAYLARRTGVAAAEERMQRSATALEREPGASDAYARALERFLALGGGDLAPRAAEVCASLGLLAPLEQPLERLSGGETARAGLAAILLARFDVFLLDEPTNDLDFAGLDVLERFVREQPGGVVVVSHDREFLDRTVTRIVEFEAETRRMREYAGGWSEYEGARERARERHRREYAQYAEERERFTALHRERREEARRHGKGANRRGTHALMSKTRSAAKRLERLERDAVDKPWEPWRLQLALAPKRRAGDVVAALERAVVERDGFRLGPIDLHVGWGERIAVTGPNGSGKSTLLEALLGRLPLAAGERRLGSGVVVGDLEQGRERVWGERPLLRAFCELSGLPDDRARTLLAKFALYADHVLRSAATLSPGERTRALLALQAARGANFLVLDEPTNHLDLPAIEELESALAAFEGTFVLVTHDRRFLDGVGVTRTLDIGRL